MPSLHGYHVHETHKHDARLKKPIAPLLGLLLLIVLLAISGLWFAGQRSPPAETAPPPEDANTAVAVPIATADRGHG